MKRALALRVGKKAAVVVLAFVALDLIATAVTIGVGAAWFRR